MRHEAHNVNQEKTVLKMKETKTDVFEKDVGEKMLDNKGFHRNSEPSEKPMSKKSTAGKKCFLNKYKKKNHTSDKTFQKSCYL